MSDTITNKNKENPHKEAVVQFFDTEYHWWDAIYDDEKHPNFLNYEMRKRKSIVIDLLNAYVKKNAHILESGCGAGDVMSGVAESGYSVTGVDINYRFLSVAQKQFSERSISSEESENKTVNLIQSDVEYLPFQDSSFDAVYCVGVLSYLQNDTKAVREISRVVKPGGIVLIALPSLFPIYKFPDPYYYVIGVFKYIFKRIRIGRAMRSKSGNSQQFKQNMIRHYRYGQLSNLFKSSGLNEIRRVSVSFGPLTLFLINIIPLSLSIKISEYMAKKSEKKMYSFLQYFANRWVICLQKNK